jgi:hypothetical protein
LLFLKRILTQFGLVGFMGLIGLFAVVELGCTEILDTGCRIRDQSMVA